MGKNTRVRQRLSSSDNSTTELQKPPTKRRLQVEDENDEDGALVEDKILESSSEEDEEESTETLIDKLVQAIEVSKKGNKNGNENGKKQGQGQNQSSKQKKKSTKTGRLVAAESTTQSEVRNIAEIIDEAVAKAVATIVPIIKNLILEAVEERNERIHEELKTVNRKIQRNRVRSVMEIDELEQYSRRDNLLITGMLEGENENTDTLMDNALEIFSAIGSHIVKNDISAIHRIGKPGPGKNRTVIVRTTRRAKQDIVGKKKQLKNNEQVKQNTKTEDKVFINEDITEPRRKLLEYIRNSGLVDFCFTREGTIVCKKGTRFIHVQNADDLFKLGAMDVKYEMFYKGLE